MRCAPLVLAVVLLSFLIAPPSDSDAVSTISMYDGSVYEYETFGNTYPGYHSEISTVSTSEEGLYIASALEGYEVTAVHAVNGDRLRYIVVPATVQSLTDGVFDGCPSLERVFFMGDRPDMPVMPDDVEALTMPDASGWGDARMMDIVTASGVRYAIIEDVAVAVSCTPSPEGTVTVQSSVDGYPVGSVGPSAFAGEHGVGRNDIRSVSIAEGVEIVRERAFFYCSGLEAVSLPSTLEVVMDEAFRAAVSLEEISIPEGVAYLGFESFRDCSSLSSIRVPDSVSFMGEGAFYICSSAESIITGSGLDRLPSRAFGYSSSAVSVEMHGEIVSIGDSAFYMCTSLESATVPDSTVSLGRAVFFECSSLRSVNLGDSLEVIGPSCFQGCSSLLSVTVPSSVDTVGTKAFAYCSSLEDVYFEGAMPQFGTGVFLNDDAAVHCTEANKDSWAGFEGVMVDSGEDAHAPLIAIVSAIVILVLVAAVVLRRCQTS